jgi:hypothetical protein
MRSFVAEGRQFRCRGRIVKACEFAAPWYESLDDPEPLIRALRQVAPRPDLFTFFQRPPRVNPVFSYHREEYAVAVLEIVDYDDWWNNRINKKTRYLVRKAAGAGVEVRRVALDDGLVRGVSAIYDETPIRQGKPFPHYHDSPQRVLEENGTYPDRSVHLGAYAFGGLTGYARLIFEQEFTDVVQFITMVSQQEMGTSNALMAKIVEVCAGRGTRFLAYGDWTQDGLGDFKRHNGFTRMVLPRYHVPLTLLGRLALRAGLHRRLADRLPVSLARLYRTFRRALNERWARAGGGPR